MVVISGFSGVKPVQSKEPVEMKVFKPSLYENSDLAFLFKDLKVEDSEHRRILKGEWKEGQDFIKNLPYELSPVKRLASEDAVKLACSCKVYNSVVQAHFQEIFDNIKRAFVKHPEFYQALGFETHDLEEALKEYYFEKFPKKRGQDFKMSAALKVLCLHDRIKRLTPKGVDYDEFKMRSSPAEYLQRLFTSISKHNEDVIIASFFPNGSDKTREENIEKIKKYVRETPYELNMQLSNKNLTDIRYLVELFGEFSYKLSELHLKKNRLSFLPRSMKNFKKLQKLDLEHNGLSRLPDEVKRLPNLQVLKYKEGNKIPEFTFHPYHEETRPVPLTRLEFAVYRIK